MKKRVMPIFTFLFITLVSIEVNAVTYSCEEIMTTKLMNKIQNYFFGPVKVLAPVLLLVFTSIDFAKAVFANDDKSGMTKAKNNFLKRSAAALLVFFAPEIIKLILGLASGDLTACLGRWG